MSARVAAQASAKRRLFQGLTREAVQRQDAVLAETDYDENFRRRPTVVRSARSLKASLAPADALPATSSKDGAAPLTLRHHSDVAAQAAAQTR